MYTDEINEILTLKYGDLSLKELNEKKLTYAYDNDVINQNLSSLILNYDEAAIEELISKIDDIEVFLEVLARLNTVDVSASLKEHLYHKYLELLDGTDPDLLLEVFEEILSYSFSSPLNGLDYYLLDLYDKMILTTFKDEDYTKFKAKAIKELRKANISKEVNSYLDQIIKRL